MLDVSEFSSQVQNGCRMRSSNDCSLDRSVDLSSLSVVDLSTSIVPMSVVSGHLILRSR